MKRGCIMSQYIFVYMDGENKNYKNKGLYDIIVFIGCVFAKDSLSDVEAYKKGKRIINSKLNKRHMTTIERLVAADKKRFTVDYDDAVFKAIWKIHRRKAKNVFEVINEILSKCDNVDIKNLFIEIRKKYGFIYDFECVSNPYYYSISNEQVLWAQDYKIQDIKALKECVKQIDEINFVK